MHAHAIRRKKNIINFLKKHIEQISILVIEIARIDQFSPSKN